MHRQVDCVLSQPFKERKIYFLTVGKLFQSATLELPYYCKWPRLGSSVQSGTGAGKMVSIPPSTVSLSDLCMVPTG